MISVVLSVYNLEKYIEKSIQSVLEQTYTDLELIIIDDGSQDFTTEICLNFQKKDSRIVYIKKANGGQGIARTLGVKISKGDYITFLDGDDWLEPDAIEKMYHAAVYAQADITVGDIWYVYQNQKNYERMYSKIRYQDMQIIRKGECFDKISKLRTFTWGKLYKKEFLIKEKFHQPSFAYEDTATVPLLVLHAERIIYINTPVYNYLKTREGSTIYNVEKAKDLMKALIELKDALAVEWDYEPLNKEIMRLFWGQIRSLINNHKISITELNAEENYYNQLICFMKRNFEKFRVLDNEEIRVYNSKLAKRAIDNIVLYKEKVQFYEDKKNCENRIVINEGEKYKLPECYNLESYSEDDIWECADSLFFLLMK